jgi:NADPH:quinone reductase-like Zn-dependent oxidoreductase
MIMQGYRIEYPDGPFTMVHIPRPTPARDQVLVRIHAAGINPLDIKIRSGNAAHAQQPLPAVLGLDMAGTVEAVGPDVAAFRGGDEVYGTVGGVGGLQGTLAQYIVVNADLLALKPKSLTMREAAALPLIAITAWQGLINQAHVRKEHRVLVHAGAGGVGHIAVQLAKSFGAAVFATVSHEKEHIVRSLGAVSIDYRSLSTADYVALHTDGRGFDIVYDTVGGATIDASFEAVKPFTGHVVSCLGWSTHSLAPLSFRNATYSGVFTLTPLLTGLGQSRLGGILTETAKLVDDGKLRPVLSQRRFSPAELEAAFSLVKSGSIGKVVVEI